MSPTTLSALLASIRKWEANAQVTSISDAKIFASSCPLCSLFIDLDCVGCPVYETTGREQCEDTPWKQAMEIWSRWVQAMEIRSRHRVESTPSMSLASFHTAAKHEVAFLESLLPSTKGA